MSSIRDIAGLSEFGAIFLRDPANVLVEAGSMLVRDAVGLHEVFNGVSAELSVGVDLDSYGTRVSSFSGPVVTSEVTATPAGGRPPYSFAWERTDAGLDEWAILKPAQAITGFRAAEVAPGDEQSATFACTVTDANGNSVVSADVTAIATGYSYGDLP